ncbi:FAA hydrolase family protein [Paenibacillus psychroresistens]|uniref:FAA hydrolase family protein n=1 Tax=Paenibacillus psychroresistens TaxID=1778678 RepID=A0A6B8RQ02_9BACL|nr:fumarylacetoacetate hydrolase family protein [Paenibacillus psychroresistens]QGQ97466.1 FAA hydrolase family protein [Paenibacillus psychroresistens]
MFENIRNVYCVGRNYALHAAELGNDVPEYPMIFTKPTHALVEMNGQSILLPSSQGGVHYEAELVLHIGKAYEKGMHVDELVDSCALGVDLTLREVQNELKKKGHPWLAAKGFLRSAPIGPFFPFMGEQAMQQTDFSLFINDIEVQRGNTSAMIFNLQTIVDYIAETFGLGPDDLIYTGTPAGVGALAHNDVLRLQWGNEQAGLCTIQL